MKVKELSKKSSPRIDNKFIQALNIQTYGEDNLYPQVFRDIVHASPSGNECIDQLADFIEGNGFKDELFSEYVINRRGDTVDEVHCRMCQDMAMFNGISLHVNYNVFGEIVELNHVPFENCRLTEPDENGVISKIAVHPDWTGKKTRNGKTIQVKKDNIDYIDVFNPIKEVVLAQIEHAGGIENYKGQVLWKTLFGSYEYPVGKGDKVATEMSTDEGLSNVKYRNVRCNFMPTTIMLSKKANSVTQTGLDGSESIDYDNDEVMNSLTKIQGDKNLGKIVEITVEADEEKPEFVNMDSKNYDKEFEVTDSSVTERIYSAFGQEPWYCIRKGKIGFSGDILSDAFEYYNSIVSRQQRFIERVITRIFKYWFEPVNPSNDYSITPLRYVQNGSSDKNE